MKKLLLGLLLLTGCWSDGYTYLKVTCYKNGVVKYTNEQKEFYTHGSGSNERVDFDKCVIEELPEKRR